MSRNSSRIRKITKKAQESAKTRLKRARRVVDATAGLMHRLTPLKLSLTRRIKQLFTIKQVKDEQLKVLKALKARKDTVLIIGCGFGKILIFEAFRLLCTPTLSILLIISPLKVIKDS